MIDAAPPAALADPEAFRRDVMVAGRPVVLRGAARHWPMLAGGRDTVVEALLAFDAGRTAEMFVGPPAIGARYHYDEALAGSISRAPLCRSARRWRASSTPRASRTARASTWAR